MQGLLHEILLFPLSAGQSLANEILFAKNGIDIDTNLILQYTFRM